MEMKTDLMREVGNLLPLYTFNERYAQAVHSIFLYPFHLQSLNSNACGFGLLLVLLLLLSSVFVFVPFSSPGCLTGKLWLKCYFN